MSSLWQSFPPWKSAGTSHETNLQSREGDGGSTYVTPDCFWIIPSPGELIYSICYNGLAPLEALRWKINIVYLGLEVLRGKYRIFGVVETDTFGYPRGLRRGVRVLLIEISHHRGDKNKSQCKSNEKTSKEESSHPQVFEAPKMSRGRVFEGDTRRTPGLFSTGHTGVAFQWP